MQGQSEPRILVEFGGVTSQANEMGQSMGGMADVGRGGMTDVGLAEDVAAKSKAAIDAAMEAIQQMSTRLAEGMKVLAEKPSQVEMEFSLKLDARATVWVLQSGVEGAFKVKLTWKPGE